MFKVKLFLYLASGTLTRQASLSFLDLPSLWALKFTPNFLYFPDNTWSYTFFCEDLSLIIMHLGANSTRRGKTSYIVTGLCIQERPCLITAATELNGKKGVQIVYTQILLILHAPKDND